MDKKNHTHSGPRIRRSTLWFLGATLALILAAAAVGISDNPPGIALLYGAGLTGVLALVHRWRSPRKFGLLLVGSTVGFFLMVVIHNFAEVGADRIPNLPALAFLLTAVSVVGFMAAVIVCPAAWVVGFLGWVATALGRRSTTTA